MSKLRATPGQLSFNIMAPMASADGYGYSAEELVRAAVFEHGADVGLIPHDWVDTTYTDRAILKLQITREQHSKEVLINYFLPLAFGMLPSEKSYGMTMFETTEIPDIWGQLCNEHSDGLIVPSEFNREVFQQKVDGPIEVVPLGVNTDIYFELEREPSPVFTFLMAGMLHYRKGAEFALRAFVQEFEPDEPVRLILKTRKGMLDIAGLQITDPRVLVVDGDYTRDELRELYRAADCFVACSRGEASGLTPREAMATGIPAIVTNWGGLAEIANPDCNFPLDIDCEETAPPICSSYGEHITRGQNIGNYARPSVSHMRKLMRSAYEDQQATRAKGKKAAEWIRQEWTYTDCSKKWLDAIENLYDA